MGATNDRGAMGATNLLRSQGKPRMNLEDPRRSSEEKGRKPHEASKSLGGALEEPMVVRVYQVVGLKVEIQLIIDCTFCQF